MKTQLSMGLPMGHTNSVMAACFCRKSATMLENPIGHKAYIVPTSAEESKKQITCDILMAK